jgi:hypothetical protein
MSESRKGQVAQLAARFEAPIKEVRRQCQRPQQQQRQR